MNKNTGIIIGIIALVVVVGGIYASMNSKNDALMENKEGESMMVPAPGHEGVDEMIVNDGESMMKDDSMMKSGDEIMAEDEAMMEDDAAMMKKEDGAMMAQ